jgi:MFS family permease
VSRLTGRQARRRYLVLLGLRWLPVGLLIPVLTLLVLDRGLTVSQLGLVAALQGLVVLALELPTGGLSDSLGRRPVLLAAGALATTALGLLFLADSLLVFALVFAVEGIHRALDSGPLQSWYVDAVLADDPEADLTGGLSAGATIVGLAIATGALTAGGLVALDPLPRVGALAVPVLVALVAQLGSVAAVAALATEVRDRRGWAAVAGSVRRVPAVIGGGLRLLRGSRVLPTLIGVELCWGFGMVTFETLMPVRLAEVTSGPDTAGAVMGPAAAAAWTASAAGAALIPLAARRVGAAPAAAGLRVLQGGFVVGMALLAGPVGLVAAYLATYAVHGASAPLHYTLLHQQVTRAFRTTVLSMNSMAMQAAGAAGLVALTALADGTSVSVSMLAGAGVLALAAPLYLLAGRAGRAGTGPAGTGKPGAGAVASGS